MKHQLTNKHSPKSTWHTPGTPNQPAALMPRTSAKSSKSRSVEEMHFHQTGRFQIKPGLALYKNPRSRFIYADHVFSPKERVRNSTRTDSYWLAKDIAQRQHKDLLHRVQQGAPIHISGPSVSDLLEAYLEGLNQKLALGDKSVKPEISAIMRNLVPFWRTISLGQLNRQTFYRWEEWRKSKHIEAPAFRTYKRGTATITAPTKEKPPTVSTLQREKTYFVGALTWGSNQIEKWVSDEVVAEIRHLPRRRSNKKAQAENDWKRAALTDEQTTILNREFYAWEEKEKARVSKHGEQGKGRNYERRLMAHRVKLMLASGLRPGAEVNDLKWKDIQTARLSDGREIIVITPCGSGKTGPRVVNCLPESVKVIASLRSMLTEFGFPIEGEASLWPHVGGGIVNDMNNSFKGVMRRLKFGQELSSEPLYICRHTYITHLLKAGISSDIIATNCGTSVEMIEKHYKHLKAESLRDALVPRINSSRFGSELALPNGSQHRLELRSDGKMVLAKAT
ncbi:site-specific integrase [Microvirga flavescens]|uniref:site-specific integrase n=1 Tax=Microvirga flavescens TaxID=2249811 RepID=UPI00130072D3|nr:site-specific integrase [Microvirga flavescens]